MDNLTASDIASRLSVMDCSDLKGNWEHNTGRLLIHVSAELREEAERVFDECPNEIDDWMEAVRIHADDAWPDEYSRVTDWKVRTLFGGAVIQAIPNEVEVLPYRRDYD